MNSEDKKGSENRLKNSHPPNEYKEVLGAAKDAVVGSLTIIGGISILVGIVELFIKLIDFLEFDPQRPDRLQLITEVAQRIETTLSTLVKWDTNVHWNETLGKLSAASVELRKYIDRTIVSGGTHPDY